MNAGERGALSSRLSGDGLTAHSMADFNEETYAHHLDEFDFSSQQKSEFMRVVWNIMRLCVELNSPIDQCAPLIESLFGAVGHSTKSKPKKRNHSKGVGE